MEVLPISLTLPQVLMYPMMMVAMSAVKEEK